DAQPPAAEGEIAHVGRIRDWHAVGRARARTWRSHCPPRHAHASAPPDRSRRRRIGMALLGEPSASGVILSPQLTPDRRSLTLALSSGAKRRLLKRVVRRTVRLDSHLQIVPPRAGSNRCKAARGSGPCAPSRPRPPAGATGRATRAALGPTPDPSRYAHRQPLPPAA